MVGYGISSFRALPLDSLSVSQSMVQYLGVELAIMIIPEQREKSIHTPLSHCLLVVVTLSRNNLKTRQAGPDPASESGSCLLNCQLHRYQRARAVWCILWINMTEARDEARF